MAPAQSTQILLVARQGTQSPLRRILRDADYPVVCADSAPAAFRAAERARPDVIVADPWALTPSDRDELTSYAATQDIPLVFGGPDRESLLAEVEASLGRQEPPAEENQRLVAGPLRIDLAARVAVLGETPLDLTAREFDLLCHLARHPGWVYSRQELLEQVWGYEYGDPQVVTVHIANLRKKAKAAAPEYQLIETVQSIGYRLAAPTAAPASDGAIPSRRFSGLRSKPTRTRIIVGSLVACAAIALGLGLGLGLGLRGEDETARIPPGTGEAGDPEVSVVFWGPYTVTESDEQGDVFWEATWFVHARLSEDPHVVWGSEVMDWSVTLPPPSAPPLGRNETADVLYVGFEKVGDASVATVIFRFDTKDWDHPGPPYEPFPAFVHHTFVVTDNPDPQPDHVVGYARSFAQPEPGGPYGMKFMDTDCTGVQIYAVPYPEGGDPAFPGS